MIDEVISRLTAEVPEFANRIQGALELSALIRAKELPNETPFAFVIPTGISGGAGEVSTGIYRQSIDDMIAVIILLEAAGDVTGEQSITSLNALINKIINAICGWYPVAETGVFHLTRGALLSLDAGTAIYQLDFKIPNQLRILT